MIKKTNILWTMATAVLALFSACTSEDGVLQENERVPIMISTAISPTRSTTTQDTQIAEDQLVYLWGFKQSGSGAAEFSNSYFTDVTDYWLTKVKSDGSLIGSSFTEKYYYPTEALTMVGIHGNFTAVDGSVGNADTHNVYADQSTLSNYAQSDLLHWSAYDLSSSSTAISAQFNHKLCKIVVVLESNLYTAADLNNALVTLNGVKPTITMTPQTGSLGSVSGTATTITPYKSDNIHREAIIPPQDKPAEFITVTMNGYTTTATPDLPATAFVANTKYIYTITVNKTGITLKTSIEAWNNDPGNNSSLTPGLPTRNVKKNPLWYVAKSNLNQDASSFSIENSVKQGYLWLWANAMNKGFTASTSGYDGYATPATPKTVYGGEDGASWHMPTKMEWQSIVPFNVNMFTTTDIAGGNVVNETCTFGYNNATKYSNGTDNSSNVGIAYKSYWSSYTANSNVRYAIRFLGTEYCSVWKYQIFNMGSGNITARLVISSRLIDPIAHTNTTALAAMMNTITDSDFDWSENESNGAVERTFYACGSLVESTEGVPTGSNKDCGVYGYYWCSTDINASNMWNMLFGNEFLATWSTSQYKTYARPIRLFRDNPEQDKDIWKNPLWYVAQYNVKYTPTSGTWDNGAGTFAFETTYNAGYLFGWTTALKYFTTTSNYSAATPSSFDGYKKGTGCKLRGWHLPTVSEWKSIFPGDLKNYAHDGTFFENKEYIYKGNLETVYFGCNYETKTLGVIDNSYWHKVSNTEIHAIRYLGTPYCSAWKYQWVSSPTASTLIVSATLIDHVANDATGLAAEIWYNNYWPQVFFGDNPSKGAVQRVFSGIGSHHLDNQPGPNSGNKIIYYWTASTNAEGSVGSVFSINDTDGQYLNRGGWQTYYYPSPVTGSFPVRLFMDN